MKYSTLLSACLRAGFCLILLLSAHASHGQTVKTINLSYSEKDFSFIYNNNHQLKIDAYNFVSYFQEDTLAPALPYICYNILIGGNQEYESFSFSHSEHVAMNNVEMSPNTISLPTNGPLKYSEKIVEFPQQQYPAVKVEYTGTHLMDGYKYLSFSVSPFTYNSSSKMLTISDTITLDIHLKKSVSKDITQQLNKHQGIVMPDIVRSLILNKDEMNSLYANEHIINETTGESKSGGNDFEYVIITDASLAPAFQPLVDWKTQKGVKAKVTTIQEINSNYSSYNDVPLRIKHYLYDMYQQGLKYALLGGDNDIVPSRICYLPHYDQTDDTPADLYFACFDNNFNWDNNGNGIYGQLNDNIDYTPEIFVSRIPVCNIAEVGYYVERIVKYEQEPDLSQWSNNILMCGNILHWFFDQNGNQYSPSQYNPNIYYMSDVQKESDLMYVECISPYWTGGSRFRLFDTWTDYPDSADYTASAPHFQIEFSKGYSFIDVASHGWINCWGQLEGGTCYGKSEAASLVNPRNTIFTTIACQTNHFDLPDSCLSVAFFRNPYSGILAYIGSSREGFHAPSYDYSRSYYRNLFSSGDKRIIPALMRAKAEYSSMYNYTSVYDNPKYKYRWLLFTLNPLGDPELSVYTSTPQQILPIKLYGSGSFLHIETGLDSCKICVRSVDGTYYNVREGVCETNYYGLDRECIICISKPGYIPYIFRAGNEIYLQHELLTEEEIIVADKVYIGSSITNSKPYGAVSIESGKTTIRSLNGIDINGEFEVKVGAEFETEPMSAGY